MENYSENGSFTAVRYGPTALLAAGLVISPVLFTNSWFGFSGAAWAACSVQPDSSYLCSGISGGENIVGADLVINVDETFQANNPAGRGLYIESSDGGIDFSQLNGSTIAGSTTGIYATANSTGAFDFLVSGDVSGGSEAAIWIVGNGSIADVSVTQTAGSTLTGYTHGIRVDNYGSGTTSITTAGTINQTRDDHHDTFGVYAYNASTATDIVLTQTEGFISGNWYGMYGNNQGTGSTTIISSGNVNALETAGLYAFNSSSAKDILIRSEGTVTSGGSGISATNSGLGSTSILVDGDVLATGNHGVYAYNYGGTTGLTVNQSTGTLTGATRGILAVNRGPGETNVTTAGNVSGTSAFGIVAEGGSNTSAITVEQLGGAVSGNTGILLKNDGTGPSSVRVFGEVSGTGGAAIQTLAANGATVEIGASAIVSATSGIAIRDGGANLNVFNETSDPTAPDAIGGNAVVYSAGTVTGDAILGLGDDTFNLTAGIYTGNIYGDDRDDSRSGDGVANHEGDDTFNWTGGNLIGGFHGQDGSDTAMVSTAAYDGSQMLDGGDDTSIADGMIDTLTLNGVTATVSGSRIINWELVILDGAELSIDDGAWHVGEADESSTGGSMINGSLLDGMAGLDFDGNMNIDSSSVFVGTGGGAGIYSFSGNLANDGTITMQDEAPGDVVLIGGDYAGGSGTILFDVTLEDDSSETDTVVVAGNTSGSTNVGVNNVGGTGAQTEEGILLVEVNGTSDGQFSLLGDYLVDGRPATVAGAYAYQLYQGGVSTPADGNWYLRSQLDPAEDPTVPLYQAGVPSYEAYPQVLLGLNGLPTLQQRVGNRFWAGGGNNVQSADGEIYASPEDAGVAIEANGVWGRIEGAHRSIDPRVSSASTDFDQNSIKLQAGIDGLLHESEDGSLISGISIHYTHGKAETRSVYGDGKISTDGYGIGGTLTWYDESGLYLDGQGQITWYSSDLHSILASRNLARDNKGFGYALSLEGGKRYAIDSNKSVTPQAQLVYSSVDFDAFTDPFGARVSLDRGESLQGRLGITLDHEDSWQSDKGMLDRTHVYGIGNLYYEFLEGTRVEVEGTRFDSRADRLWGGLGMGGSYNWDDDKYSLYGEGLVATSLSNFADSYSLKGQLGFRMQW